MKILFICSGNTRGANVIVKNQGYSLIKIGIQIRYFLIEGKGLFSYIKHIYLLRKERRIYDYAVFHAHYSFSGIVASLAGYKPIVVSLMGSDTKKNFLWKSIIRLFSKYSWDITIVKSHSMKIDSGLNWAKIIPNGVNLDFVKPKPGFKVSEKKIVLFASDPGRPSKNFKLAQDAISLLKDDTIEFRVIYQRPHEEVIDEINHADLLLVTSRWEGSPNIIKEAMTCNCPVVSTNVGDVEWLFGDEPGHYITSFNPEDVANKIKLALEYAKINGKTKGRDRIITLGLDSGTIANKIVQLYNEIAENRK